MKKMIQLSLIALFSFSNMVYAKSHSCGYKDFFHLGSDTSNAISIKSISGDSSITVQQVSANSFYIKDANCSPDGGYAHVRMGYDSSRYCDLVIHDGEFMFDPDVTTQCTGMNYNGMTYDGTWTYSYSLHFN